MQPKNQVTTLEQSKKIDELWFKRESYFVWRDITNNPLLDVYNEYTPEVHPIYKAYTVSELMEYIKPYHLWNHLIIWKHNKVYTVWYWYITSEFLKENKNLAQALWDMLIYLIENHYIKCSQE
jgi:hypothetical protein